MYIYSSSVGGHGSDNKHKVEADYELQSESLAETHRWHRYATAHRWFKHCFQCKRRTHRGQYLRSYIDRHLIFFYTMNYFDTNQ